jgi:hypothetical protein
MLQHAKEKVYGDYINKITDSEARFKLLAKSYFTTGTFDLVEPLKDLEK